MKSFSIVAVLCSLVIILSSCGNTEEDTSKKQSKQDTTIALERDTENLDKSVDNAGDSEEESTEKNEESDLSNISLVGVWNVVSGDGDTLKFVIRNDGTVLADDEDMNWQFDSLTSKFRLDIRRDKYIYDVKIVNNDYLLFIIDTINDESVSDENNELTLTLTRTGEKVEDYPGAESIAETPEALPDEEILKSANGNAKMAYNATADFCVDMETRGTPYTFTAEEFDASYEYTDGLGSMIHKYLKYNDNPGYVFIGADGKGGFFVQWKESEDSDVIGQYPNAPSSTDAFVQWGSYYLE